MLLVATSSAPARGAPLSDTIDRIRASVVGIGTVQLTRRPPFQFKATGFVVADGLHVITNAHVLPDKLDVQHKEFVAILPWMQRGHGRRASVVAVDRDHDVALLEMAGPALAPMSLGDAGTVREGALYAFTGFPIGGVLGMRPVTHRGIVSSITPIAVPQLAASLLNPKLIKRLSKPYDVFQLDATAYPGNSGSPLYEPGSGAVVGIVNRVFVKESKENVLEHPSGITYAIPVNHAAALLRAAGLPVR